MYAPGGVHLAIRLQHEGVPARIDGIGRLHPIWREPLLIHEQVRAGRHLPAEIDLRPRDALSQRLRLGVRLTPDLADTGARVGPRMTRMP